MLPTLDDIDELVQYRRWEKMTRFAMMYGMNPLQVVVPLQWEDKTTSMARPMQSSLVTPTISGGHMQRTKVTVPGVGTMTRAQVETANKLLAEPLPDLPFGQVMRWKNNHGKTGVLLHGGVQRAYLSGHPSIPQTYTVTVAGENGGSSYRDAEEMLKWWEPVPATPPAVDLPAPGTLRFHKDNVLVMFTPEQARLVRSVFGHIGGGANYGAAGGYTPIRRVVNRIYAMFVDITQYGDFEALQEQSMQLKNEGTPAYPGRSSY